MVLFRIFRAEKANKSHEQRAKRIHESIKF